MDDHNILKKKIKNKKHILLNKKFFFKLFILIKYMNCY